MRRGVGVAAGLGLLALAYGVHATTPEQPVLEAPFPTAAVIGEAAASRHLGVTVHEVVLADVVVVGDWRGTTSGIWLAGELTATGTTESRSVTIEVFAGDARYPASKRLDDGLTGAVVDAGLPRTGAFAVELPADIVERGEARSVVIRISTGLDSRLDSVVDLTVDLTALDRVARVEYDTVRHGSR